MIKGWELVLSSNVADGGIQNDIEDEKSKNQ